MYQLQTTTKQANPIKTVVTDILLLIAGAGLLALLYFISDYPTRIQAYESHMCDTYGEDKDCFARKDKIFNKIIL